MEKAFFLNSKCIRGRSGGFTLLEIVIVGIILMLILASGLELYKNYEIEKRRTLTADRVVVATNAIENYFAVKGAYPCPSTLGYGVPAAQGVQTDCRLSDVTDPAYVIEGTCSTDPDNLICAQDSVRKAAIIAGAMPGGSATLSGRVIIGALPYKDVTLREEDTFDGYGSRLYYAVSQDLTAPATFHLKNAALQVLDEGGEDLKDPNAATPQEGTRFVVFSVGKNKVGGYSPAGNLFATCAFATYSGKDYQNCDFLDSVAPAIFTVQNQSHVSGTEEYDDIVSFEDKSKASTVVGWRRGDPAVTGELDTDLIMPFRNLVVGSLTRSLNYDASMSVFGMGGLWTKDGELRTSKICDENYGGSNESTTCFSVDSLIRTCPAGEYVTGIGRNGTDATRVYCQPIQIGCPQIEGSPPMVLAGIDPTTKKAICVPNAINYGGGPPTGGDGKTPIERYCDDHPADAVCTETRDYNDWYCDQPANAGEQICQSLGGALKLKCIAEFGIGQCNGDIGDYLCLKDPTLPMCQDFQDGFCIYNPEDPRCTGDENGDGHCDNTENCFDGGDDDDGTCEEGEDCYGDGTGDDDDDGTCEEGEDCYNNGDGVCQEHEACYGDGSGDDDDDGTCEVGEDCYTDSDGTCERDEACYGDGSGDDDDDGTCEEGEGCYGDDDPGTDVTCSSGDYGAPQLPKNCDADVLISQGGIDPNEVKKYQIITETDIGTPGHHGNTINRTFEIKKMKVCYADGSSDIIDASNTAKSDCCNLPDVTPKYRWFRCNNKTSGSNDNTQPVYSSDDCTGIEYSSEMLDSESNILRSDPNYQIFERDQVELSASQIPGAFSKKYDEGVFDPSSRSSGGCGWNATEGIVFQKAEVTSSCTVNWITLGPTDPEFGYSVTASAPKTISGVPTQWPLTLALSNTTGLAAGDLIYVDGVSGMQEINKKYFRVSSKTATNITLKETGSAGAFASNLPIDGTDFTNYISGGTVTLAQEDAGAVWKDLQPTSCYPTAGRVCITNKGDKSGAAYNGERSCKNPSNSDPLAGPYSTTGKCRWAEMGSSTTISFADNVQRAQSWGNAVPHNGTQGLNYHPGTCVQAPYTWVQGATPSGPVLGSEPAGLPAEGTSCDPDPDGSIVTPPPVDRCWKRLGSGWQVYSDCGCKEKSSSCVGLAVNGGVNFDGINEATYSTTAVIDTCWPTFSAGNVPIP